MPRKRQIPERTCIACGLKGPKGGFVRIVRTSDGSVFPDPTGRSNGRGAYLCNRANCWEQAVARRALERSFRGPVASADLEALKNYFIEMATSDESYAGTGEALESVSTDRA